MIDETYRARAKALFAALDKEMCRLGHASGDWCGAGLSEEEMTEHERKLGVVLPDEYKACFSLFNGAFANDSLDVLHAGETYTGFYLSPLEGWGDGENILLLKDAFYNKKTRQLREDWLNMPLTVRGPAKAIIHHRQWIPITMPFSWYSWYADFAPEPGGSAGQIVLVTSDCQSSIQVDVVARDFFEFMEILISSAKAE